MTTPGDDPSMATSTDKGIAVVVGARGGIGSALVGAAEASGRYRHVLSLSRSSEPALDVENEASVEAAAIRAAACGDIRLCLVATGLLHGEGIRPEKAIRDIDPAALARSFSVNAIGPALVMKHILPRLPRRGRSVLAVLSAKVGSIGDNRLGGWYAYRASKAALNQLVRTAAIELARHRPEALCVAIHPGTVDTRLSSPFAKAGLAVADSESAAVSILACLDRLTASDSGGFFDRTGERLPW
ncbi:SDR family NAD(P)-dependent oxidoreductase [Aquibium microcysteis]|uniref:SDR family NAD(P)-dependent oxidoreductase n=1 Tax=Aquibium microcysteis TaxID=675281 RepID=UPI001EF360D7|nr:SDR family NAD(P)-dependent oxidoreductase [Aquibium microcysteis]